MSRIVLIEDDEGIAELLSFNLEWAGHQVLVARDGAGGLTLAQTSAPDVVLLDLDLRVPGPDGLEVGRRLQRSGSTPVITLTSREGDQLDAVMRSALGAYDYVPKPFSVRDLLARIASVVQPLAASESSRGRMRADVSA